MRPIIVRHYWQDYNDEDICDGDIDAPTHVDVATFTDARDLVKELNEEVFWIGDRSSPPETSDGGETIYYHCEWPRGFKTGDPRWRSGSVCFDRDRPISPHLLRAVIAHCNIYDANRR